MGKFIKIVLPPLIALAVGLGAGFFLGKTGEAKLRSELVEQKKIAGEDKKRLTDQASRCAKELEQVKATRGSIKAREQLLRALLELDHRNYGLASQHLGSAKKELEATPAAAALADRLAKVQTLTMQLKPAAREEISKILAEISK